MKKKHFNWIKEEIEKFEDSEEIVSVMIVGEKGLIRRIDFGEGLVSVSRGKGNG